MSPRGDELAAPSTICSRPNSGHGKIHDFFRGALLDMLRTRWFLMFTGATSLVRGSGALAAVLAHDNTDKHSTRNGCPYNGNRTMHVFHQTKETGDNPTFFFHHCIPAAKLPTASAKLASLM